MSENYIGEIRLFAGNFAPQNWAFCDGSLLSIQENDALFSLIGTTYGGDGQNTFGLPDLRGRIPIGQGNGQGLTPRTIGQNGGEESHTLTVPEMPGHGHPVSASTANATTITAGTGVLYGAVQTNAQAGILGMYTTQSVPLIQMDSRAVAPAGASASHNNTMNTLSIAFIIATQGIYPTQS